MRAGDVVVRDGHEVGFVISASPAVYLWYSYDGGIVWQVFDVGEVHTEDAVGAWETN